MKKHIIGFAIFSFIIGSAVFVKAIFPTPRPVIVPVEDTFSYNHVTKRSCWKMREESFRPESLYVRQAVLDLNTRQMSLDLVVPKVDSTVAVHFFAKDASGTRYLATEVAPTAEFSGNGVISFTKTYSWMDDLDSYKNLYVVPQEVSSSDARAKNFDLTFNSEKARAVTLVSVKVSYKLNGK